jgi:pimeloyl-ACP methyl ester carboxylesterase
MSVSCREYGKQVDKIKTLILLTLYTVLFYGTKAFHFNFPYTSYRDAHKLFVATADDWTITEIPTDRPQNIRFISPLLEYGYSPAVDEYENNTLALKPLLLYLPGFDGTFLSPFLQFPELHTIFDIRCMVIATEDRSTFDQVCDTVVDYIQNHLDMNISSTTPTLDASSTNNTKTAMNIFGISSKRNVNKPRKRQIYLAGESFGGIVAVSVLQKLQNESEPIPIRGLALINAATCYDRSRLALEGLKVAEGKKWLYAIGLIKLLPLFADQYSLGQLLFILQAKALPSVIDNEHREAYLGRVAFSLPFVVPFLSQETLWWRLQQWLMAGCTKVGGAEQLKVIKIVPTLIVAGEADATLPSIAEAERLASIVPDALVHVVPGAGHASTCGSRIDLAALFRSRFPELRSKGGRLKMKSVAAAGQGPDFGMEPRYDNATIGLNPLRYWTRKLFRQCSAPSVNYIKP